MAQIFQLPIGFQYFRRRVKWFLDEAVVIGWAKHQDGSPDTDHVQMRVSGAHDLTFHENLADIPERLNEILEEQPDCDPVEICSGWSAPIFWFEGGFAATKSADAWEMRSEFLKLTLTPEEILIFLNSWGPWRSWDPSSDNCYRSARLNEIVSSHKRWIKALLSPPERWYPYAGWSHSVTARVGFPPFWVSADGCKTAIDTTITIDFLNGASFAVCGRPDCNGAKYFAITSGHLRKYCSQYCGHIESVRRGREAKRRKSQKSRR
jgi:hypothetical protein